MPRLFRSLAVLAVLLVLAPASAQTVDVTFRFIPDLTPPPITPVVRAYAPGSFNDWGPNNNGQINVGAPSQMDFFAPLGEYRYTETLSVGQDEFYKLHYHRNASGTQYEWISDPLAGEPCTFGGFGSDCRVQASDPMAFQLAREQNGDGQIFAVSAGLFGSEAFPSVTFTVNEEVYTLDDGISDTGDGIFRLVLPAPVPPGSFFGVEAEDVSGDIASASIGSIPPTVIDAPVPVGIEDGITTLPDGTTTFVLRAPAKSYVYLLGSFNGFSETAGGLMFRDDTDPRGTRWWVEVDGLTPGQEYTFTYLIDGTVEVADPYSPVVYYPGEGSHPGGTVGFAVGAFTAGGDGFVWTDDDWAPPAPEDLVVYELLVRDFLADHSFTSLTDTLDYLQRLGVNAVELMPVSEFDGDESWGYNPAFHLALDKYYGTPTEFKAFVNEAHARGIAVLLDVVYNHATGQSPLVRLYNSGGFSGPTPNNPYANVTARHPFNVFNDLNHESALTQIWLDKANRFWIEEYHVDGYRFDLTGGFMQSGEYFGYNPGRVAILERMMDALWDEHPDAIVILEHLVENDQEWGDLATFQRDQGRPGALLWHKMEREYAQGSMGYPTATDFPSALTQTYPPNWAGGRVPVENAVVYMESHDEQWMMWRNQAFGNQNGPYDIRERLHIALDRQKMMGAFFFTVPGPRMVWQFGELGYGWNPGECLFSDGTTGDCPSGTPGRTNPKPIRWDYWADGVQPVRGDYGGTLTAASDEERAQRQKLYKTWSALIHLRNDYAIFRDPDTDVDLRLGLVPDRYIRLELEDAPTGQPTEAIIFGNHGVAETTITLTFDEAGTWYDFFDDTETTLEAGSHTFTLLPGEFRVWTNTDVPSPEPGLITVDNEAPPTTSSSGPRAFPNPAASRLGVELDVASPGLLVVEVLDVLGRRVATLHEGVVASGRQRIEGDVRALPAGVYLVRATVGNRTETVRVTVAR